MSYKTNITKIQTVGEPAPAKSDSEAKASVATSPAKDTYTTKVAASGGYRNLVEGKRVHPRYHQAIQEILGGMAIASPVAAGRRSIQEEDPMMKTVDLEGVIFKKDPERHQDMKPVLDRYIALEKMLTVQIIEIKKDLTSGRGTAEEMRILWKKLDNYKREKAKCSQQLDKARVYWQWQKQNSAEAAKKKNGKS